ncbi:metallophosphoesterase family protein [Alicyclobacillus sendaiensis]|uniref:Metallophosphoesterase family protein n=1 Tax=Alicyclobacillus sendaiensis PA2 TaxID=3029425 RepID=A0ABT6XUL3_ALISE|nr:metallophosphoesterase family protein [Alicyclobacillus sendaiensis]MDI9258773.1 metallophosphoesterase family protein [Alicyclobacillus sendaiensis PA2]
MPARVAALYDIHGNLAALDAVLQEVERAGADALVFGGDLAFGPQPRQVLERVMSLGGPVAFVRGNTDREVAERHGVEQGVRGWIAEVNAWCHDQLTPDQREFLLSQKAHVTLHVEGLGDVRFVHGSPRSDEEAIRRDTPEAEILPMVAHVREPIIVCGHTHIQFDRMVAGKRVVNAGSVGLPSAARGACWALISSEIELRETLYDFERAAAEIRKSGAPKAGEFADHILNPPVAGP